MPRGQTNLDPTQKHQVREEVRKYVENPPDVLVTTAKFAEGIENDFGYPAQQSDVNAALRYFNLKWPVASEGGGNDRARELARILLRIVNKTYNEANEATLENMAAGRGWK